MQTSTRTYAATVVILAVLLFQRSGGMHGASGDIVLRPGAAASLSGAWTVVSDSSAAGGVAVRHADANAPKITVPLAQPAHYFELTFDALGGVPYHVWFRARAQNDYWGNDSVFVQFDDAVGASGERVYAIGTASATVMNLERCSGCGLSGWGWEDNGWGPGVLGPEIRFRATGRQVMRVQTREDGLAIDQIVLSPQTYVSTAPGSATNDDTIVPVDGSPSLSVVRFPYLQQMTSSGVFVVWAAREQGDGEVRYGAAGSPDNAVAATRRLVSAAASGLGYDYYHYEAHLTGLVPDTTYSYEAQVDGVAVSSAASFETAPAPGSGTVSFIAFGDSGTGSSAQRQLAAQMAGDTFDIALHAGDIAYGNSGGTGDASIRTYQEWFFNIYRGWLSARAFFPSEGNHDSRPSNGDGVAYLDVFSLPRNGASGAYPDHAERYYSFDYGPVHFIALDTEFAFQDTVRRAEQLSWLEADLAATGQPWKVAFFHRSPYSAGGEHGSDLTVRSAFGPLFERYGVQLVLSAHEHDYERTRPWRESPAGSQVTYVVTGGGGPLYPAGTAEWTAYSASRYHYVRAHADACTLQLDAIGLSGAAFDGATLTRCGPPPPSAAEVVLYAADAVQRAGAWALESDSSAADGRRVRHPDAGAAKLKSPLAQPAHYFELTFEAAAAVPYRFWLRGRADRDHWSNDSVYVQFDHSTDANGQARYRIGTTDAESLVLEDCNGCGVAGWGWQDTGWGSGVLGPAIYFDTTGPQRLRVQTREDGMAIDQIVLSPSKYMTAAPGALKNDTTILTRP